MDRKEYTKEKLKIIRNIFSTTEGLDDKLAMEIILEQLFSDDTFSCYSQDEQTAVIEKIFSQTRSKLGILQSLIKDEDITEIMVNGPDNIFIEKDGHMEKYPLSFDSIEELEEVIRNIAAEVHREITEMNPIVDARLADGSRVNGVYKNVAINGPILTIRKFSEKYMRMEDLIANGTLNKDASLLLETLVTCGYNIFVSGGTSSGKTTLLNALAEAIPREERVIVIEDSAELKLGYIENIVHMECRNSNSMGKGNVTMSQLIKSSLRMRPDRIIVGEVRGEEVVDMLQAMNTGHQGSLSTGHANSVAGMLKRLESLYLMAIPLNIDAIRGQIAEGIDIMVHIEKTSKGRRITQIAELSDYKEGKFKIKLLMELRGDAGLCSTGNYLDNSRKVFLKGENYADRLQNLGFLTQA